MTTVDIPRANGLAAVALGGADDNLARLGQWVEAARNAHQLVAPLVGTAFVPDAYRPKVDPRATPEERQAAVQAATANATAAVLYGLSLGIDPLMALQQIYVVHGRPGMYAKMMVALVQGHGHEVWTEDLTETRAVVCGRRKGSQHTERITITMEMARKAKWTSNSKYAETPQDMLWARAAGRVCDRIASDVLKGIATVEQIEDETVTATAEVGTRTVSPRAKAWRGKQPAEAPAIEASTVEEPPLEPTEEEIAEEPVIDIGDAPPAITDEQRATLSDLLGKTGRRGQTPARNFLAGVLGRKVSAPTELTAGEAEIAIAKLLAEVENNQAETAGGEEPELPL